MQVRRVRLWHAVSVPLPEPPALLQQNTLLPIWNILMWVYLMYYDFVPH